MNTTTEQRIAALENEIRALRASLGAQQRTLTPPPPRSPESSVRISHPTQQLSLPSADDCCRLCAIVWRKYPALKPRRGEEEEFARQFPTAFRFVQSHGRRADLDRNRGIDWWVDNALSRNIGGLPISGLAFVVAVISAGDVLHTDPTEPGFVVGLQFGGGGSPATDYWRRVLSGTILEALPPLYPKPMPAPSRIVRG
jgi:hypothetical protein